MTAWGTFKIACDWTQELHGRQRVCRNVFASDLGDPYHARQEAERAGWDCSSHIDLCPEHA